MRRERDKAATIVGVEPVLGVLSPRCILGWDAAAETQIVDQIVFVFLNGLPALVQSGNRWLCRAAFAR